MQELNFDKEVKLCVAIQEHYNNMQRLIEEKENLDNQIKRADENIRQMTGRLKCMLLNWAAGIQTRDNDE